MALFRICVPLSAAETRKRLRRLRSIDPSIKVKRVEFDADVGLATIEFSTDDRVFTSATADMLRLNRELDAAGLGGRR